MLKVSFEMFVHLFGRGNTFRHDNPELLPEHPLVKGIDLEILIRHWRPNFLKYSPERWTILSWTSPSVLNEPTCKVEDEDLSTMKISGTKIREQIRARREEYLAQYKQAAPAA